MFLDDAVAFVGDEFFHQEAIQKPVKVVHGDIHCSAFSIKGWPAEPAPFPAFVVEGEAVFVPMKDFDLVLALVAEDEEGSLEWIQLERALDHSSKPIDGLSHVDGNAGKIDRGLDRKSADRHRDFNARRTSSS